MGEQVAHDFKSQLSLGQRGEMAVRQWLEGRGNVVREAPMSLQRIGCDLLVLKGREWLKIEVKTDYGCRKYGNGVFVEECVEQSSGDFKMGWSFTSQADWMFFLTPPDKSAIILKNPVARGQFLLLKEFALEQKVKRARNKGLDGQEYFGLGFVVPYERLAKEASMIVELPVEW